MLFSQKSSLRSVSGNISLALTVNHHLDTGTLPAALPSNLRFPDEVDVVSTARISLKLSGVHNQQRVSSEVLATSALVGHLVKYLRVNATKLGLAAVSDADFDDNDGALQSMRSLIAPIESGTRH
ncbi:hypothetical protein HGRIS_005823 [Hohenbuehelia grisea]|uniref:Uncharacterized protein n=1 Tax=Hohenbuehelia grisea TaxID=104357 RepID=A0ABR3JY92_9AGAR